MEVDAPRITRHCGIEPAKQFPERHAGLLRLQVPQRDVEGRKRQHGGTAAPAVMGCPPELVPQMLDPVGILADRKRWELTRCDVEYRAAIVPAREGVSRSRRSITVGNLDGDYLEGVMFAMHRIDENLLQRQSIKAGFQIFDRRHFEIPAPPALMT
jgi:hypothetical protein